MRPRIVVAEDDDELRALLEQVLGRGADVVSLEDGFELADYLELAGRPGTRVPWPDLVVSDVAMPGRTGLDVLEGAAGRRCPFILISAFATSELRVRAAVCGAALFFDKPFDVDVLAAAVDELLEHERAS